MPWTSPGRIGDRPRPVMAAVSFAEFEGVLARLHAKLAPHLVHALYLGALTSTNFQLGPQRLLDRIFGDTPVLGESLADANAALQVLFGYWNTLNAERRSGRVRLAPIRLPASPTTEDLLGFAQRRLDEITWFIRGIDAGGDDPTEFGPEGQKLLEGIAHGSGYLTRYAELLERETTVDLDQCRKAHSTLLALVATVERLMGDLMGVSDAVRREALATFQNQAGRQTDDGATVAQPIKIGRNEPCPCGSGKKWKKCCGVETAASRREPLM